MDFRNYGTHCMPFHCGLLCYNQTICVLPQMWLLPTEPYLNFNLDRVFTKLKLLSINNLILVVYKNHYLGLMHHQSPNMPKFTAEKFSSVQILYIGVSQCV